MPDKDERRNGGGVPRIAMKPAMPPFFDRHEREVLQLEVFLMIAAFAGAACLGVILAVLRSVPA